MFTIIAAALVAAAPAAQAAPAADPHARHHSGHSGHQDGDQKPANHDCCKDMTAACCKDHGKAGQKPCCAEHAKAGSAKPSGHADHK